MATTEELLGQLSQLIQRLKTGRCARPVAVKLIRELMDEFVNLSVGYRTDVMESLALLGIAGHNPVEKGREIARKLEAGEIDSPYAASLLMMLGTAYVTPSPGGVVIKNEVTGSADRVTQIGQVFGNWPPK